MPCRGTQVRKRASQVSERLRTSQRIDKACCMQSVVASMLRIRRGSARLILFEYAHGTAMICAPLSGVQRVVISDITLFCSTLYVFT